MEQRARTPEQKREVIEKLYKLWLQVPDWRFMQMLGNVWHIPSGADPYNVEDYEMPKSIEAFIDSLKTN